MCIYAQRANSLISDHDHRRGYRSSLNKPVEDITKMLRLNERVTSVDTPIGGENDKALLDILTDEADEGPEGVLQDGDLKERITEWLEALNPKQKEVLARRFGLLGYEPSTLEDVGHEIGLTRERVRRYRWKHTEVTRLPASAGRRRLLPRVKSFYVFIQPNKRLHWSHLIQVERFSSSRNGS